jgi:ABC-type transport system substrate-binding protein
VDFTAMQNLKLEVFEGWHEAVPYISQIECVITREESAERTAFEQALIDMYVPSQLDWRTYSEIEVKPIEYTTSYLDIVGFNFQSELLNDIDFRQAIAYAIDREAILSTQYLDHGVITDGILHPDNYLLS